MVDPVLLSIISITISVISLIVSIVLYVWGKRWEYGVEYKVEYIRENFQPLLYKIKKDNETVTKYLNGELEKTNNYGKINDVRKDGGFGIIKKINQDLYNSLIILDDKINPKINKLMQLRNEIKQKIITEWTEILQSKGEHKGIAEKSLVEDIYDKTTNAFFMGKLEIIDEQFHSIMKQRFGEMLDYEKNPYPEDTIEDFKKVINKYYPDYKTLFDEIKELKEKHVDTIIIPKLEEKIENPL